jgi:CubicO group peptidase (beta-lactamase class C family)
MKKKCFLARMKKILLTALLALFFNYNPGAVEVENVIADKLRPGNVRLTNDNSTSESYEAAERIIRAFMRKWCIEGASVAIAKEGQLLYAKGFGYVDTLTKEEVQPYHKFRTASISKLVTAIAVMKLAEEGKLSLNDKVFGQEGILNDPYFSNPRDKRAYDITVAHLLSHKGGWSMRWGDHMFMPLTIADRMGLKPPVATENIVRYALDRRLHYTPGKGKVYSNLGYSILGLVIEKISGMPYEQYCQQAFLEPLGIYDMRMARNMPSEKAPFEVTYYEPSDIIPKLCIYGTNELVSPCYGGNDIEALGAAGAWLATAPDLIRLVLAVDGFDSHEDILDNQSIDFMTDNSNGFAPVGWKTTFTNGTWWRTGSYPGSAGMLKRMPDGTIWAVLLNTSAWNGPEIHSFVNMMMARVVSQIRQWPEEDLFNYALPVPLYTNLDNLHYNSN